MEKINEVIKTILSMYNTINNRWKSSENYIKINQRKNQVIDIVLNPEIMENIIKYREYVNNEVSYIECRLQVFNNFNITNRVKQKNSIESKIGHYILKKTNGKSSMNKCINDIYGIRIIVDDSINYGDIQKLIDLKYPNLKCILSKRGEYEATHIYFSNDNYSYEWELQIWNKSKAKTNIESHKKYKQEYTKWEDKAEGGDL